jgi:hypothetical protein
LFAKLSDTSDGAVKTHEKLFAELEAELELHRDRLWCWHRVRRLVTSLTERDLRKILADQR